MPPRRRRGSGSSSANGSSVPSRPGARISCEKKRVITTPSRKSPSRGSRPLAVRERERQLRVARAGRAREREAAAEARVDVGDRQRAVGLAEALDVRRARRSRAPRRRARPYSISSASLIVMPLIDSPPFDSIIVRGIAFRQRPSRSQKTSIENSSPRAAAPARTSRPACSARKKSSSSAVVAAEDVARAEALARLHEHREAQVVRQRRPAASVGGDGMPRSSKKRVREVLVVARAASTSGSGQQHERRRARRAPRRAAGGRGRSAGRPAGRRAARRARAARRRSRGRRSRGTSAWRSAW